MDQQIKVTRILALLITLLLRLNFSYTRVGTSQTFLLSLKGCYPEARKVKIESAAGGQVQMFELQVLSSDDVNIALGKTASQSSTFGSKIASFAVDGNVTTASSTNDTNSWWEVDLGNTFPVKSVIIENHWCEESHDPNGCLCSLSEATLSLLDELGEVVSAEVVWNKCNVRDCSFDMSTCSQATATTSKKKYSKKRHPMRKRLVQAWRKLCQKGDLVFYRIHACD